MFGLKPKENKFFHLFIESTLLVKKSVIVLHEALSNYENLEQKMNEMAQIEHEADALNDAIIDKLNQSFITPLDREDIYHIATKLDDIVDLIEGVIVRMVLYKTKEPSPGLVSLAKVLQECTTEIEYSFSLLPHLQNNQEKILEQSSKIEQLESEGDRIYREEVAFMFSNCKDPFEIIKWKEILEHLEDAVDECERMADLLRGVVMKYA